MPAPSAAGRPWATGGRRAAAAAAGCAGALTASGSGRRPSGRPWASRPARASASRSRPARASAPGGRGRLRRLRRWRGRGRLGRRRRRGRDALGGGGVYFCSRARFSSAASVSIRPGLPGRCAAELAQQLEHRLAIGLARVGVAGTCAWPCSSRRYSSRGDGSPRAADAELRLRRALASSRAGGLRRPRRGRPRSPTGDGGRRSDRDRRRRAGACRACGRRTGSGATGTGTEAVISGRWRECTAISGTATAPPTPTIAQHVPTATFCTVAAPPPPSSWATMPHGLQAASRRRRRGAARRSRW